MGMRLARMRQVSVPSKIPAAEGKAVNYDKRHLSR
jgi:hypothetical protein